MRKVSEILRLMISSGRYSENDPFMCNALHSAKKEGEISGDEKDQVNRVLNKTAVKKFGSDFGYLPLATHLRRIGKLPGEGSVFEPGVFPILLEVYEGWIAELEEQGQ